MKLATSFGDYWLVVEIVLYWISSEFLRPDGVESAGLICYLLKELHSDFILLRRMTPSLV